MSAQGTRRPACWYVAQGSTAAQHLLLIDSFDAAAFPFAPEDSDIYLQPPEGPVPLHESRSALRLALRLADELHASRSGLRLVATGLRE